MAELFSSIEDLEKHIYLDSSFSFSRISPYLEKAERKYLNEFAGTELVDAVKENIDAPTPAPALAKLLPYLRDVVAHFGFLMASPDLDIKVQEMGFQVAQNNNSLPASGQRVDRFNENRESQGWDAVEELLKFLEENEGEYPEWTDSTAYTVYKNMLIRSAAEFNAFVNIKESRVTFRRYQTDIVTVEMLRIAPEITDEYFAALKNRHAEGSLTAADKAILPLVQAAIANFTHFIAHPEKSELEILALKYIGLAKKKLWGSPDDYPEFKNSPSFFTREDFAPFKNSDDNAFFLFGGGGSLKS